MWFKNIRRELHASFRLWLKKHLTVLGGLTIPDYFLRQNYYIGRPFFLTKVCSGAWIENLKNRVTMLFMC